MKTMLEVLKKARELIASENNWVKGKYATGDNVKPGVSDFTGLGRSVTSVAIPGVDCFCSVGAVHRAAYLLNSNGTGRYSGIDPIADAAVLQLGISLGSKDQYGEVDVIRFNDYPSTEHSEVLALFDRTINRVEKEQCL